MKALFTILSISLVLFSCTTTYFTQIQPKDGAILSEIPKEYQGEWIVDDSRLTIKPSTVTLSEDIEKVNDKKSIRGTETYTISDSFVVKSAGKYCVFNVKEDSMWVIFIFKHVADDNIEIYHPYINDKRIKKTGLSYLHPQNQSIEDSLEVKDRNTYIGGQIPSNKLKKIIDKNDRITLLKNGKSYILKR
ncbi:MAG: hypothetical protein M9916_09495 [Crocinitomicaceae bacterium]|nr:hypothetical protein [Crocinitomicaceae bacterium]